MKERKLTIKVGTFKQALNEFKTLWKQAEHGKKILAPVETLHFENTIALMKVLTPKRLELLQQLHSLGNISIRALAKKLLREYSNVHKDVKALHHAGLVLQDSTGKYYLPWDKIVTELPMTQPVINKTNRTRHKHSRCSSTHAAHH